MCFSSQQPEPDINKPDYSPDDMDKQFELTKTDTKKKPVVQDPALADGAVPIRSSGIKMRG